MMRDLEKIKAELRMAKDAGDSARVDELLEQLHAANQVDAVRRAVNPDSAIEKRG